jgi:hypothetical protein
MSAGGLSYHGVVGHVGKATLPSVSSWGQNMNILRDPPKSIQTRKIDKVGQTSEITQMIQESGDRYTDAISVYARGIDPMVSVSYTNYGNNGGQRSSGVQSGQSFILGSGQGNSGTQAFLPYRIMDGGAFRPPAKDQRELLPLSRLPRIWTSSFSQPGFVDFSKKATCSMEKKNTKEILKACIRPTSVYTIDVPVIEPFEIRYVIKNPLQISLASVNKGGSNLQRNADFSTVDTSKYTRDILNVKAQTNIGKNKYVTPIDKVYTEGKIKDKLNISCSAHKIGYSKYDYIHSEPELERVLPQHNAQTNKGQNIYRQSVQSVQERNFIPNRPVTSGTTNIGSLQRQTIDNISSRQYKLAPTIQAGSYNPKPSIPTVNRQKITEFDNQKSLMRQRVYNMQQERYGNKQAIAI